jgi:hypothetical protein
MPMISFRLRASADHPAVDPRLFREAMNRPSIARELFLPLDRAWWDGDRFTLGRWSVSTPRPALRGVRLQVPRSASQGPPPERDTQNDLAALVGSVVELRKVPDLSGLVLSGETLVGKQNGTVPGKRVLFGVSCNRFGRFQAETPAAAECHRVLQRALKRAGFAVDHPGEPFNPTLGLAGLREWASTVRLRRKSRRRAWALLIFLLPLLLLVPLPGSLPSMSSASPATPGLPSGAPPAPANTKDLLKSLGQNNDLEKLLKEAGGSSSNLPANLGGTGPADHSADWGTWLIEAGTVVYFVSGAWLLWAAPNAGIGAALGLLLIPGYALVVARSNWSKTWVPLLVHIVSMVMIIGGIWLVFSPYYRMIQSLL